MAESDEPYSPVVDLFDSQPDASAKQPDGPSVWARFKSFIRRAPAVAQGRSASAPSSPRAPSISERGSPPPERVSEPPSPSESFHTALSGPLSPRGGPPSPHPFVAPPVAHHAETDIHGLSDAHLHFFFQNDERGMAMRACFPGCTVYDVVYCLRHDVVKFHEIVALGLHIRKIQPFVNNNETAALLIPVSETVADDSTEFSEEDDKYESSETEFSADEEEEEETGVPRLNLPSIDQEEEFHTARSKIANDNVQSGWLAQKLGL